MINIPEGVRPEEMLQPEQELFWLALRLVPGLGTRNAERLIRRFRTPEAIFRASRSELEVFGLPGGVAQSIASGCSFEDASNQQEKLRRVGVFLVPLTHPSYPPLLREIIDPPTLLFVRGRVELLQSPMVGVVGTRRPTRYGLVAAERLSGDLARAGVTITSGMARGIDTAAHQGALAAEGTTVAVLGCGVDVVYPSENSKLANDIALKGALVSEFPMGTSAFPQNFPVRNRIISGVSAGVLVVEGAQYSGSAITARLAMEQGRDVFAVPGNITSKESWGPNLLIKQGAKLIQDWNDVVTELPPDVRCRLVDASRRRLGLEAKSPQQASLPLELPAPLAELGRWVLDTLKVDEATQIDLLLDSLDRSSPSELIAVLFELEMLGAVRQLPGKNFVKVWET